LQSSLQGASGGALTVGTQKLSIQMPRAVNAVEQLGRVLVTAPSGRTVHLSDVARIDFGLSTSGTRSFKTSGAPSLILFASPRAGGNVKEMSEQILALVASVKPSLPPDVQYRVLVDPSEFIRAAVSNVFHEVVLGSLLAVVVLFLFIGSFRNVLTAAIEIPLSMVLAFLLMKLSGMNLNIISLGGLALSAGMNVDASVVVLENIFRHFEEHPGQLDAETRVRLVLRAVREVWFAVVASTVSSLVVFAPLAFTSGLSYAVLGDLAKTVVFSHGFSAFVALILVPTVRLHLMSRQPAFVPIHSPIEKPLRWLENGYSRALGAFLDRPGLRRMTYLGVAGALALVLGVLLPRLPREVLGTPDTDWMYLSVTTSGNTMIRQMEGPTEETEARLLAEFGDKVQYTFVQVFGPNSASVMARLKHKSDMEFVWKHMEEVFANTPFLQFYVGPWNPAELPLPNPPQLKVIVTGADIDARTEVAREARMRLEERQVLPRISTEPDVSRAESVVLKPHYDLWTSSRGAIPFAPADLADFVRVMSSGKTVLTMPIKGEPTNVNLGYPLLSVRNVEDLAALPIGLNGKIVPLKALAQVEVEPTPPTLFRVDGHDQFVISGRKNRSQKVKLDEVTAQAREVLKGLPGIQFEDAEAELNDALHQLGIAVGLSVLLIFVTLVLQFGGIVDAALVLVAIPLGLIGVGLALFVFRSTLSLNSALGVILLNGIAVANSILLVDLLKRLVARGLSPRAAAREAARQRLRPILITSLTTVLGMLPIALGFGEGGRILQPLGIAVSGGLWVSMGLTLFVVPALQVAYLEYQQRRAERAGSWTNPHVVAVDPALGIIHGEALSSNDDGDEIAAGRNTRSRADTGGHA
jgi:HAE1 family hydrophobic/amphiphilic exporter-1